jgi:hypothetical protein
MGVTSAYFVEGWRNMESRSTRKLSTHDRHGLDGVRAGPRSCFSNIQVSRQCDKQAPWIHSTFLDVAINPELCILEI